MNEKNKFSTRRERHVSHKKEEKNWKKEVFATFWQILIIFIVLFAVRQYFFVPVSVEGDSMEPTLQDRDRLLLQKFGDLEKFDIIVFPAPDSPDKQYIKRVIGLPGDHIEMQNDHLFINGEQVDEPYLDESRNSLEEWESFTADFELSEVTDAEVVPEGHYFVMGDNRENSKDSRSFGFIPIESVLGKTEWRLWPLDQFGRINDQ